MSWGTVSTATGYNVYRSAASGTTGALLGTSATNTYVDATAVAGNLYYYSVAATNAVGASSISAQVSGYVAASTTGGGALSGATLGTLTTANLTTVGTSDWAHWPEFTGKVTGGGQISNYAIVGTTAPQQLQQRTAQTDLDRWQQGGHRQRHHRLLCHRHRRGLPDHGAG